MGSSHCIFEWKGFWEYGQIKCILREHLIDHEAGMYAVYACQTRGLGNCLFLKLYALRAFV